MSLKLEILKKQFEYSIEEQFELRKKMRNYQKVGQWSSARDIQWKIEISSSQCKCFDEAISKGIDDAKKNLIKVPVMHGTIPHDQLAKEGAAKVLIKPAAHGTGVIAGGSMRAVLESAGVTDVLAKSLGSANPHNVVKATFKALAMLREPITISKTRRLALKKVFNG